MVTMPDGWLYHYKMNPTIQKYLVSSLITFVSTFLTVLGGQIAIVGSAEINSALLMGMLMIAGRAATKGVLESIPLLGNAANPKSNYTLDP